MQTDVYIKIINEKMNKKFWMAGFLVIPKVYAVIASPFSIQMPQKPQMSQNLSAQAQKFWISMEKGFIGRP